MLFSPQLVARRPVIAVVGGGVAYTSFDAASLSNATLSNSNLTATRSNTSAGGAKSLTYKSSGKFYFEVTVGASHANTDFIGAMASSVGYSDVINGTAGNYSGYWHDGRLISSGSTPANIGTSASGDVVSLAYDLDNLKYWVRLNGGNWNNSGTADPATNTGGFTTFASMAPSIGFSTIGSPTTGDNFTANFGAAVFTYSVPSGFTSGWPT